MKYFLSGILIASVTAVLDQYSKYYIFNILSQIDTKEIRVTQFFNLVMVRNYGVSFGMFNNITNGQLVLSAVALCITAGLLVWMWRAQNFYIAMALGLIIGGAIGNITDRVLYGWVADFLDFYWGAYHWPAFNLADSTVFIGVLMILLENFVIKGEGKNAEKS